MVAILFVVLIWVVAILAIFIGDNLSKDKVIDKLVDEKLAMAEEIESLNEQVADKDFTISTLCTRIRTLEADIIKRKDYANGLVRDYKETERELAAVIKELEEAKLGWDRSVAKLVDADEKHLQELKEVDFCVGVYDVSEALEDLEDLDVGGIWDEENDGYDE